MIYLLCVYADLFTHRIIVSCKNIINQISGKRDRYVALLMQLFTFLRLSLNKYKWLKLY